MATTRSAMVTSIRGYRITPAPTRTPEYKGTLEENVADMKDWARRFAEDRARRGVPKDGLRLPGGVKRLSATRRMQGVVDS